MVFIYRFQQQDALCAQHALNMLLQQDYVGPSELSAIARRLDSTENQVLDDNSKNKKSQNMSDSGYFSVQVISEALRTLDLELIHIDHPSVAAIKLDPLLAKAFICNQNEHWFTLRKFGQQWFLLNSVKDGPELISDTYLSMYIHELYTRDTGSNSNDVALKAAIKMSLQSDTHDSSLTVMKNIESKEENFEININDDVRKKREAFLKRFQ
uniref:ubiquitinyl hydrolase 1 n=1 Tax=Heterorhabditis bacteriophora TaxID=37862 RepID=A0A1I7WQE5_HETBA